MNAGNRVVEQTLIGERILVSTVFLGLDHNIAAMALDDPDPAPILWETMTFFQNGWEPADTTWCSDDQERYSSLNAATKGHRRWCNVVRRRLQEWGARHGNDHT